MDDDRAQTVVAMLDLVDAFLPRALLIENVAGFLRGKISASPFISERLAAINEKHGTAYDLRARIVDAADYGVPQRRNRVIGIATRDGHAMEMPSPTHADAPIRAWDAIGDLAEVDVPPVQGAWAELLPSIPEGGNYQHLTARGGGGGEELFGLPHSILVVFAQAGEGSARPGRCRPARGRQQDPSTGTIGR